MPEAIYSLEQVSDWQAKLADLAEKPRTRFSKKQAVEAMIEQIELALQSHPYDEVAQSLKEWGLDIAAGSLKQYVNAYRREHNPEGVASARKRSTGKRKKKVSGRKSQPPANKATSNAPIAEAQGSRQKAVPGISSKAVKAAADSKPDSFIEMPEEL